MNNVGENYVRLEEALCPVCGLKFQTGALLLHKQLKDIPEEQTLTHMEMCPEHAKLRDEGYVALVAVDPDRLVLNEDNTPDLTTAIRTGAIVHLRKERWNDIFDVPVPEKMMAVVDPEVTEYLARISGKEVDNESG